MELTHLSFQEIVTAVKEKKVSAKEITKHFLNRIETLDKQLNSFITVSQAALQDAEKIDARLAKGESVGPLAGVPFGIKDMLCTKGLRTTAGSKMLENFIPPYDATVVARLKKSGVVVLGKTNQDEFAMGSSNETSHYGEVKNPWNLNYVPGGSSGGSAAAQAARLVAGTIGTDTGGSIRQPSSFCNLVGVKPTYGRVPRYGIIAYASSLDQAGPMVSSVTDAALTLEAICGHDEKDSTSSQKSVPRFSEKLTGQLKGLKVGLMKEYMNDKIQPDTLKTYHEAIETVKKMGAEVVEVSVPLAASTVPVYYLVASSEASSNLARYDGVKYGHRADLGNLSHVDLEDFYAQTRAEGFGYEVKRRIMLGTYSLSSGYYDAYYNKACQVRRILKNQFDEVYKKCHVILSPVTTSSAFKLGERITDPLSMYLNDIFTVSTNLAGLPGMSVPFGMSSSGLPIGIQLTAGSFDEENLLNVAYALELNSSVKGKHPHVI